MPEHIVSFLSQRRNRSPHTDKHQIRSEAIFHIELAGITFQDPNYSITRNKSHISCMEYIMEGGGTVHVDNTVFHPVAGDIYILPKGHNHHYYSSRKTPWKKIWINFRGSLCDALLRTYQLEGIMHIKNLNLYHLFQKLLETCESKDLDQEQILFQCSLIFHEILANISQHIRRSKLSPSHHFAYEILDFIDRNIYEKITLKDIAASVCLSESQITRVFKKEFNETPYHYILSQKIETAKLLLSNTNMSVKQIALKLNFADEHYFSNIFKKKTGISPRSYTSFAK